MWTLLLQLYKQDPIENSVMHTDRTSCQNIHILSLLSIRLQKWYIVVSTQAWILFLPAFYVLVVAAAFQKIQKDYATVDPDTSNPCFNAGIQVIYCRTQSLVEISYRAKFCEGCFLESRNDLNPTDIFRKNLPSSP